MKNTYGYYKGWLELNGFKTPFVVYADSDIQAETKALHGVRGISGAIIHTLEGPYQTIMP